MYCSNCGNECQPEANFCSNCGLDMSDFKYCSDCGLKFNAGEFCSNCGLKLSDAEGPANKDDGHELSSKPPPEEKEEPPKKEAIEKPPEEAKKEPPKKEAIEKPPKEEAKKEPPKKEQKKKPPKKEKVEKPRKMEAIAKPLKKEEKEEDRKEEAATSHSISLMNHINSIGIASPHRRGLRQKDQYLYDDFLIVLTDGENMKVTFICADESNCTAIVGSTHPKPSDQSISIPLEHIENVY